MDKIFEKKGLGRPVGMWETKRNQYFDMISNGKVNEPRGQTLDYYNIKRGDDGKHFRATERCFNVQMYFGKSKSKIVELEKGSSQTKKAALKWEWKSPQLGLF